MSTISERKSANGSKWQAKVRRLGHPTYSRTFDTREEAEAWAGAKEASLDAGQEQVLDAADALTVADALAMAGKAIQDVPENIATSILSELHPEDIIEWASEPTESTEALQGAIEYVRREFDIRLPRNPVAAAYARTNQPRDRRIPDCEEEQLLNEANNTRGGYLYDCIIIALDTALMQHEIVKLDWSNIDLDRRIIKLPGKLGERIIPLTERTVETLRARGAKVNGEVFPGLSSTALQRAFIRTVERAKINDLHFNDLRYEALCRMRDSGLSVQQLWSITGSKTLHPLERILSAAEGQK